MLKKLKSFANLSKKEGSDYTELTSNDSASHSSAIVRKDLQYRDLLLAFDHISNELHERHGVEADDPVSIMVCGGVCSVMVLRNREQTKDIDFYTPDHRIIEAISDTQQTLSDDLRRRWPSNWVTAEMLGYLTMPGCEDLYQNSVQNNLVLYESSYLKVIAADWRFQLISKIFRAYQIHKKNVGAQIDRKKKDLDDALAILALLVNHGLLNRTLVRSWYHGSALDDEEIDFINKAYRKKFGADAII